MHPIIKELNQEQMQGKIIPDFSAGDTVIVKLKIKEGDRERLQSYEGVVIAKKNRGLNSSFTARKISHDEGVERVFQTYSHQIESIIVKRKGDVRKAKLYYLRDLSGRKARIREKIIPKSKLNGANIATSTESATSPMDKTNVDASATEAAN